MKQFLDQIAVAGAKCLHWFLDHVSIAGATFLLLAGLLWLTCYYFKYRHKKLVALRMRMVQCLKENIIDPMLHRNMKRIVFNDKLTKINKVVRWIFFILTTSLIVNKVFPIVLPTTLWIFDKYTSLVGTFLGAILAFAFGWLKVLMDKKNSRIAELKAAQFALLLQMNDLTGLKRNFLDPYQNTSNRHLMIPQVYTGGDVMRIDYNGLKFVASSRDANLLQELHLAEQQFDTCQQGIVVLREKHIAFDSSPHIKRRVLDRQRAIIENVPADDEGWIAYHMLKEATDNLYIHIHHTIPTLNRAMRRINEYLKLFCNTEGLAFDLNKRKAFKPRDI